ncbi:MAG: tryptophan synthase subunit beta, partial [Clostridium sp.]|nr:tryptophan synthase subunit beta [Clostridium sp.]
MEKIKESMFGEFGGQYVPENLKNSLTELESEYNSALDDPNFIQELNYYLKDYVGRENPLYYAEKFSKSVGNAKIYLKREDLNHTGAHKINNALGQGLLAKRMGKKKVIAETGAGQHGVATATVAALLGLECEVFMGTEDMRRQSLNVFRMNLLGAKVTGVSKGTGTLKDAVDVAISTWINRAEDTFYILGSAVGPHPYPSIVKNFQEIISDEARKQILEKENRLPDYVIACVGGGSNAIGAFSAFIPDNSVKLIGVEAAGLGLDTDMHAATLTKGTIGIVDGMKTYVITDEFGNVKPVYSISAGLDYPGIGPEHAYLKEIERAEYVSITDMEAIEAFKTLSREEGIIPAIESSHALAYAMKLSKQVEKDTIFIVNLSGRGDKDVKEIMEKGYIK